MEFIDPINVVCPRCKASAEYPVRDLLALTAVCGSCGSGLEEIGEQMRKVLREGAAFFGLVEVAIELETEFSIQISDEQLARVTTGEDLVNVLASELLRGIDRGRIRESIQRHVAQVSGREVTLAELGADLTVLFASP